MSLLSKYYYKKFMVKTLSDRVKNVNEVTDVITISRHGKSRLSLFNETYESAAFGLFASSGDVCTAK